MKLRGLVLAGGLSAVLALVAVSCAQILGVADQQDDVVADMCLCRAELSFLGETCDAFLRRQLDGVTDEKRASWLAHYAQTCGDCSTVRDCFYTAPTCATLSCTRPEECCSYRQDGGCDDAGQCY